MHKLWETVRDFFVNKVLDSVWLLAAPFVVTALAFVVAYFGRHQGLLYGSIGAAIAFILILLPKRILALFQRRLAPSQAEKIEQQFKHILEGREIDFLGSTNTVVTTSMAYIPRYMDPRWAISRRR